MPFKVREKKIVPKVQGCDPLQCEDVIVECSHAIALFDGHSGRIKEIEGVRAGRYVALIAGEGLANFNNKIAQGHFKNKTTWSTLPSLLVNHLTAHVRTTLTLRGYLDGRFDVNDLPGCVGEVLYSVEGEDGELFEQIVRLGDPHLKIDNDIVFDPHLAVDRKKEELRSKILKKLCDEFGVDPHTFFADDPTKEVMRVLTQEWQRKHYVNSEDKTYGYAVICDKDIPDSLIEVINVPRDARRVTFTSDGCPLEAITHSLTSTEKNFRRLRREDPLCYLRHKEVRGQADPCWPYTDDWSYISMERV